MIKCILMIYMSILSSSYAEILYLKSGVERNTLVELYTSEGCSSCPPAESFLNDLQNNKELWNKYVPVAFHVDYWDYIGWKDQYATKEFGLRQSHYASLKRASTVYTPAFMVNGSSWRPGLFSKSLPDESLIVGKLNVSVNNENIHASYKLINKNKYPLRLNVAILGMGLTSHIERGENEGRKAKHEFVVVGFNSKDSNNLEWDMKLPKLHYDKVEKYALAIWVSEVNNPTPLQVVGGILPNYKK